MLSLTEGLALSLSHPHCGVQLGPERELLSAIIAKIAIISTAEDDRTAELSSAAELSMCRTEHVQNSRTEHVQN